jgi:hypothetical protein
MSDPVYFSAVPWESRNLGMPSFSVDDTKLADLDEGRFSADLDALRRAHPRFFMQARIRKEHFKHAPFFQRMGFYFVESTLAPFAVFRENACLAEFDRSPASFVPGIFDLASLRFHRESLSDPAVRSFVDGIARESFSEDRFHHDPRCSPAVADGRFVHWIGDLAADREVVVYLLDHDGVPVGFMARKNEYLILTGFAKTYVSSGLSGFFWLSTLKDMAREGLAKAHTLISVHNTPVLNMYSRIGFKFREPCATFHLWRTPE